MIESKSLVTPFVDSPSLIIVGPTAIGKTELALILAETINAEIIGVDSMQIYKYMDIGTAKPTAAERNRIRHYLVDFVDPADDYNVARYVKDAQDAYKQIKQNKKLSLFTGGTGLYFTGLFEGFFELPSIEQGIKPQLRIELVQKGLQSLYNELVSCDPESALRIHRHDQSRIIRALEIWRGTGVSWSEHIRKHNQKKIIHGCGIRPLKIGLQCDRELLYQRINNRVGMMLEQGLLAEVEGLLNKGYSRNLSSMQSLGYRHMINYIEQVWSWDETKTLLARDTRRYAKRQLTWFRKDNEIIWIRPDQKSEAIALTNEYLSTCPKLF